MRINDAISLKFDARDRDLELDLGPINDIAYWIELLADHILDTAGMACTSELRLVSACEGSIEFDFRLRVKIDRDPKAPGGTATAKKKRTTGATSQEASGESAPVKTATTHVDEQDSGCHRDPLTIAAEVSTILALLIAVGAGCRHMTERHEDAPSLPPPSHFRAGRDV